MFQGCFAISSSFVGKKVGYLVQENSEKKECTFEEFMLDKESIYGFSFGAIGSFIDIGILINYFNATNPAGFTLYLTANYLFGTLLWLGLSSHELQFIPFTDQKGWNREDETKCEKNYFVIFFKDRTSYEQGEAFFLKAILNYPHNQDISQDQNFLHFQKDFLRNNKMQTYYKDKYFYRYIHYPGGKAKFEEDFGKYLYKP